MARGKHAGDPNSFEDTSSYRRNRTYEEDASERLQRILKEAKNDTPVEKDEELENSRENLHNFRTDNLFDDEQISFDDEEGGLNYKKVAIVVIILIAIVVGLFFAFKFLFREEEPEVPVVAQEEPKMIEKIEGYRVLGKIKIEDLSVDQYILDSVEESALKAGVGKLYGGALNNYGNLCLAGHNFEGIFEKLSELEKGDIITLVDRELEETEYEIKDIFSVEPDNLECLLQDETKVELTLITCENGATTRLVVKAEEKDETEVIPDEDSNTTTNTSTNTANTNVTNNV